MSKTSASHSKSSGATQKSPMKKKTSRASMKKSAAAAKTTTRTTVALVATTTSTSTLPPPPPPTTTAVPTATPAAAAAAPPQLAAAPAAAPPAAPPAAAAAATTPKATRRAVRDGTAKLFEPPTKEARQQTTVRIMNKSAAQSASGGKSSASGVSCGSSGTAATSATTTTPQSAQSATSNYARRRAARKRKAKTSSASHEQDSAASPPQKSARDHSDSIELAPLSPKDGATDGGRRRRASSGRDDESDGDIEKVLKKLLDEGNVQEFRAKFNALAEEELRFRAELPNIREDGTVEGSIIEVPGATREYAELLMLLRPFTGERLSGDGTLRVQCTTTLAAMDYAKDGLRTKSGTTYVARFPVFEDKFLRGKSRHFTVCGISPSAPKSLVEKLFDSIRVMQHSIKVKDCKATILFGDPDSAERGTKILQGFLFIGSPLALESNFVQP